MTTNCELISSIVPIKNYKLNVHVLKWKFFQEMLLCKQNKFQKKYI